MVWSTEQTLLDDVQIQQMVGTTSGNHAQISGEHIEEGSGIAIQAIQPKQDRGSGEPKVCRIAGDYLNSSPQFASVIPVARPAKRAEKLMRMRLEDHRPGANNLSPLAALIARRAHQIKPAMGSRQGVRLRKRSLAGHLSCPIHIHYCPLRSRPVEQAARRSKWGASQHILVKARTQGLHRGLVKGSKKARQG